MNTIHWFLIAYMYYLLFGTIAVSIAMALWIWWDEMPYAIRKDGNQYDVVKKETGELVSHHDTHKKAVKAIRAIYARESATRKDHRWFG